MPANRDAAGATLISPAGSQSTAALTAIAAPKENPASHRGPSRSFLAHPVDSGEHVTDFPFPIVKATFALSDAGN